MLLQSALDRVGFWVTTVMMAGAYALAAIVLVQVLMGHEPTTALAFVERAASWGVRRF